MEGYDTVIEPFDWRDSAAIVGLHKYLRFVQLYEDENVSFQVTDDAFYFNRSDINEEWYFHFVEEYYQDKLLNLKLTGLLLMDEFKENQINQINRMMVQNKAMKHYFAERKFDGTNAEELLDILTTNHLELTKRLYLESIYANFANPNQFFEEKGACCRLWGYYVEMPKKGRSISHNGDMNTFEFHDGIIYDFIPFAFLGDREFFFINDNYSIKKLIKTNREFEARLANVYSEDQKRDSRKALFKCIKESADFLSYRVEVIHKDVIKPVNTGYYETLFIQDESIKILKQIEDYDAFCFSLKITERFYLDIQRQVTECILNLARTDPLIELFLKRKIPGMVYLLIQINQFMTKGGERMKKRIQAAIACAKGVATIYNRNQALNRLESTRNKLITALASKDSVRFCDELLRLSASVKMPFWFAECLYDDFEKNRDVAYAFTNALIYEEPKKEDKKNDEEKGIDTDHSDKHDI